MPSSSTHGYTLSENPATMPVRAECGRQQTAVPDLTLVIPAFNEESRLPRTLWSVREFLEEWGLDYRVLVADDGSRDQTPTLSDSFGERFSTISLTHQRGKGAAVRAGMLSATGRVIAFTDADLPFDLSALKHGYQQIQSGERDVVFGARDLDESTDLAPRKLSRKAASITFRWIVSRLISREITDTQCGLKLFSEEAAKTIFSRLTIEGFAFDAEVIYLTHQYGLRHARVPVTLINEHSSTLSLSRHAWPMLRDIIALRWKSRGIVANLNSDSQERATDLIPLTTVQNRKAA